MADIIPLLPNNACTFTFRVEDFTLAEANVIDNANSLISAIYNDGGRLIPGSIAPDLFHNDLMLIESSLPLILAHLLIKFLLDGTRDFASLSAWLERTNPLKFAQSLGHKFYEYKLKRLLIGLCEQRQLLAIVGYKTSNHLLESAILSFQNVMATICTGDTVSLSSHFRIELTV